MDVFYELSELEVPIKNISSNHESKLVFPHNIPTRSATGVYNIPSDLIPPNKAHPSFRQLKLLESSSLYIGSIRTQVFLLLVRWKSTLSLN